MYNPIVNCEWSAWIIGECSVTCGGGTQPMHRTKTEAIFGGADCEGDKDGVQNCNTDPCSGDFITYLESF